MKNPGNGHQVVSDPSEQLILVDDNDTDIGNLSKTVCHQGDGVLHRAFSIFLFNASGELLLQQRSADKPLWPLYWSNTCCSHPRQGESMALATQRRMQQELGIQCPLTYLYKFQYQANYGDIGAEHELCSVYVGSYDGPVDANATEIADLEYLSPDALDARLEQETDRYTPWFRMEWQRLRRDFGNLAVAGQQARASR